MATAKRNALMPALAVLIGAALAMPTLAASPFADDPDRPSPNTRYALPDEADLPEWKEAEIELPPAPEEANLVELDVNAATRMKFEVDAKALTVGPDGVVRYTIVVTSPGGARTVNYEGIRCSTFERRLYAFGHKDGSWTRSRNSNWSRIPRAIRNGYQETLALDYFCQNRHQVGTAEEIIERIRRKQVLNPRIQY